jgi:hypothetical protein
MASIWAVNIDRNDMDANEHEGLPIITLGQKLK